MSDEKITTTFKEDFARLDWQPSKNYGLTRGANHEMTMLFKVIPGHEEQAAEALAAFQRIIDSGNQAVKIGIHDFRLTMLENNTRILFATTFDPDINWYIDEAISRLAPALNTWWRHCVGYPEPNADGTPKDPNMLKEWYFSHWNTSSTYFRVYPVTISEVLKGLKVNEAFQQVLDDPDAAEALQHPALKPLLDLASD